PLTSGDRRRAIGPRLGLLELGAGANQVRLLPVAGGQERPDRQSVRAPVQRQRCRRAAGDVGDRVPWVEGEVVFPPAGGGAERAVEFTEWRRRLRQGRRQPQIVPLEELADP